MSQKIGIYAGTFDPIHDGHVAFAEMALSQADLDSVVFLPEPTPRRKTNVTPADKRVLAIKERLVDLDRLEVRHIDQAQFTIDDTMPVLRGLYPGAKFSLLIGSDLVHQIHYWPHFEVIRSTMRLIVGLRQGADQTELANYLDTLGINHQFVRTDFDKLSSSQFRR